MDTTPMQPSGSARELDSLIFTWSLRRRCLSIHVRSMGKRSVTTHVVSLPLPRRWVVVSAVVASALLPALSGFTTVVPLLRI